MPEFTWTINGLSRVSIEKIHESVLDLLKNIGIKVEDNQRALEIFHAGGCIIEQQNDYGIAKIPSGIVEDCLQKAPRNIKVYGRSNNSGYE
ncbi:MAG: trimethylamine methyltransferase family protein, partial [Desulfobacterales bacterium]